MRKGSEAGMLIAEIFFGEGAPRKLQATEAQWVVQLLTDGAVPEQLQSTIAPQLMALRQTEILQALGGGRALPEPGRKFNPCVALAPDWSKSWGRRKSACRRPFGNCWRNCGTIRNFRRWHNWRMILMAAISVPRALRRHEELPVGGISDITNRGSLDKLLLTELAHDDLTLAVRIATNEALYMRRETPPARLPQRRAILIDSGIRLWGVPRLFATAVALAFAAAAPPGTELLAFGARQNGIVPLDLATRNGLIAHLEALEPAPHPGAALASFAAALATDDQLQTDVLLITHEDVLADPDFAACLHEDALPQRLIATVNRAGAFRLYLQTLAGRQLLSEADMKLDDLLAPSRVPSAPLVAPSPDEPLIMSLKPFPLLLPASIDAQHAVASARHGLVAARYPKAADCCTGPMPTKHARELPEPTTTRKIAGNISP